MIAELADGADGGTITQIAVLITALGGVAGAWRINRRDGDREERKRFQDLQKDMLTLRGYIYSVRVTASDHGVELPDPPHLLSEDWDNP